MATTFYRGKEDMSSYAVRVGQFVIIGKREDRKKEERNQRETRCLEHVKVLKKEGGKKKPATFKESKRYNAHFKL